MKVKGKVPSENTTKIILVLDRSGSMDSIAQPTVEGINTFIKEQKGASGDATMTLVQFDDRYEINYVNKPISEVEDLIYPETYKPRGTTALYDAIGRTINEVDGDDDVVFVIVTDGEENASKEFTQENIFNKIEEKKKIGWNFLFLAANQDAMKTGSSIGINKSNSVTFNSNIKSVETVYANISGKISSYRNAKSMNLSDDEIIKNFDFSDSDRDNINK